MPPVSTKPPESSRLLTCRSGGFRTENLFEKRVPALRRPRILKEINDKEGDDIIGTFDVTEKVGPGTEIVLRSNYRGRIIHWKLRDSDGGLTVLATRRSRQSIKSILQLTRGFSEELKRVLYRSVEWALRPVFSGPSPVLARGIGDEAFVTYRCLLAKPAKAG